MSVDEGNQFYEPIADETTQEYPTIEEGYYLACLGLIKKNKKNEAGKDVDFILLQRAPLNTETFTNILDLAVNGTESTASLRKDKSGRLITSGFIYTAVFNPIDPTKESWIKGFMTHQRKQFAAAFNSFDDKTNSIKWSNIQKQIGQVVAFELVKNKKNPRFCNIDFEQMVLQPGKKVSIASLKEIYSAIEAANTPIDKSTEFNPAEF